MTVSAGVVVVMLLAWLASGVTLSVVMGRRGHFAVGWAVMGAILGPLAVVFALETTRHEREERPSRMGAPGSRGGPIDVLVGVDGSAECAFAVERAVTLLGPQLGRLTLATVVPFDDAPSVSKRASEELERRARLSGVDSPGQALLHGQPAHALADFAAEEGYALLAVGTRGSGMSKRLLGSTARQLASGSQVPVLMVSADPPDPTGAA